MEDRITTSRGQNRGSTYKFADRMLEPGMRDEEQKKRKIRKQMVGGGDLKGGGRRGAGAKAAALFFFLPRGAASEKKKSLWEGQKKRRPLHGLALTSAPGPITVLLTFPSAAHPLVFFFSLAKAPPVALDPPANGVLRRGALGLRSGMITVGTCTVGF